MRSSLYLLLLLIVAAAIRLDLLVAHDFTIDSDEAIVGLMGSHILQGRGIPVFYYGQHYMGSFEALASAAVFSIVGVSSAALKITPLMFSLFLILQVYALGRLLKNEMMGRIAALFIAIPPSPLVVWSSMARGGFIELLCIGTAALHLSVKWYQSKNLSLIELVPIGLLLGLGWWVNNQIIYFCVPVGLYALMGIWSSEQRPSFEKTLLTLKGLGVGLVAFVIGGLPFWWYNINHDWVSFEIFRGASSGQAFGAQLGSALTVALPMILGARRFWSERDLFPGSTPIALTLFFGFFLYFAYRAFRSSERKERALIPLTVFVLTTLLIFASSSFGHLVQAPRYLLPLYPIFALIFGFGLVRAFESSKVVGMLFGLILFSISLSSSFLGGRGVPGEPIIYNAERVQRSHAELIEWLLAHNYGFVETNYWVGYRLAFETHEKIRFKLFQGPAQVRLPEYEKEASLVDSSRVPMVLTPAQGALIVRALRALCYTFDTITLSGYVVVYNITIAKQLKDKVSNETITATASHNSQDAFKVIDGSPKTRWGSAHPQRPTMWVALTFAKPQAIQGLEISLGDWLTDGPRELQIIAVDEGDRERVLLSEEKNKAVHYYLSGEGHFSFCFPSFKAKKIILKQKGKDKVFDWSIAEVTVYK